MVLIIRISHLIFKNSESYGRVVLGLVLQSAIIRKLMGSNKSLKAGRKSPQIKNNQKSQCPYPAQVELNSPKNSSTKNKPHRFWAQRAT